MRLQAGKKVGVVRQTRSESDRQISSYMLVHQIKEQIICEDQVLQRRSLSFLCSGLSPVRPGRTASAIRDWV